MKFQKSLVVAFILLAAIFLIGSCGYKILSGRHYSFLECAYKAIMVLTTISEPFSEVDPVAIKHPYFIKLFTLCIVLFGLGILLYTLSAIAAFFVEGGLRKVFIRRKMDKKISKLNDHFIVCGAGETGIYAIKELVLTGWPLVVIDSDDERLQRLEKIENILSVTGDATEDEVLLKAGIERSRGIILVLPSDKDNLFATLTVRGLNPNIKIVTRGIGSKSNQKLLAAGADSVVSPNFSGGVRMASELIRPQAATFLDNMLRGKEDVTRIEEVTVKEDSQIAGKTLSELKIPDKFGLLVLGAKKPDAEDFVYNPHANFKVDGNAILVVLGKAKEVNKLRKLAV